MEGELVVACVQCKFVKDKVPLSKVKEHMRSAVKPLRTKKIGFFPVIYATPDQDDTIQESTYKDGVYFNEVGIFKIHEQVGHPSASHRETRQEPAEGSARAQPLQKRGCRSDRHL